MRPRYYVTTWDMDSQVFTPQVGVRTGPYSLWGLKRALRKLQAMGYSCDRGDNSVLVERQYCREADEAPANGPALGGEGTLFA